jgi:hypothetical protein
MTQFEEQPTKQILVEQDEQHVFAYRKSTKYVTTIEVFRSIQFVITITTTLMSYDEGDDGHTQTIVEA